MITTLRYVDFSFVCGAFLVDDDDTTVHTKKNIMEQVRVL